MEKPLSQQDLPRTQLVYIEREGHRGWRHIWLKAGRYLSSFVWTGLCLSWRCCRCYLLEWHRRPKAWREESQGEDTHTLTQQLWGGVATGSFVRNTAHTLHFFSVSGPGNPALHWFGNVKISGCREETMALCRVSSRVSPPLVSTVSPLRLTGRQSSMFPCQTWKKRDTLES